jgi:hypothetical protein
MAKESCSQPKEIYPYQTFQKQMAREMLSMQLIKMLSMHQEGKNLPNLSQQIS